MCFETSVTWHAHQTWVMSLLETQYLQLACCYRVNSTKPTCYWQMCRLLLELATLHLLRLVHKLHVGVM